MKRYSQLLSIIDLFQPRSIIETGVWNGKNAGRMIFKAQRNFPIEYTGYDLFEDATSETDAREFNVKPHNSIDAVTKTIRDIAGSKSKITLVKGDTNDTLKPTYADLAFIDGGHSLKTIAHDYEMLKTCKVIVFDDYYTPDENGACPDTNVMGCNKLVHTAGFQFVVLPDKDPVSGGGYTQFVMVLCQS